MRIIGLAIAACVALEGTALACSCIPPSRPSESRVEAQRVLKGAVAVAEVDVVGGYRWGGRGERLVVHRVLWGTAPKRLTLARGAAASSASCDVILEKGERRFVVLSRRQADDRTPAGWRIQSLCSDHLVSDSAYRVVLLEEARRSKK